MPKFTKQPSEIHKDKQTLETAFQFPTLQRKIYKGFVGDAYNIVKGEKNAYRHTAPRC